MTWSWHFAWSILPQLLSGLLVTVKASLLASVIALMLGVPVAIARYRRIPVVGQVLTIIVDFLRGTPLLVQLYFVYYALPTFGLTLPAFTAGVLTLGLYTTAYTAETYRAGIESVPSGQWDATSALSLPARAAWIRVVIPQALRPIIPSLGNYVIGMFKESVLLEVITVPEIMTRALDIGNQTYRFLEPMTLVGLLFWAVSYPCALAVRRRERQVARNYE